MLRHTLSNSFFWLLQSSSVVFNHHSLLNMTTTSFTPINGERASPQKGSLESEGTLEVLINCGGLKDLYRFTFEQDEQIEFVIARHQGQTQALTLEDAEECNASPRFVTICK